MTVNTSESPVVQQEDFNQVSKPYRTYVLTILTLVYAFNFIDRQIIGLRAGVPFGMIGIKKILPVIP